MNRVIVVLFNERSQTLEGLDALKNLDRDDSLTLHEYAIIQKQTDGTCVVLEEHNKEGLRTLLGTSLGALIGLPGGPPGVALGAVAGTVAGATAETDTALMGYDFVHKVTEELTPGKFALIAVIDEEWTKWTDLRMQELAGTIYRYTLPEVKDTEHSVHIAELKADLVLLKAELAQANADAKASLYEKINRLNSKIQEQLKNANEKRRAAESKAEANANLLRQEAGRARKEIEFKEEPLSLHEHKTA